MNTPFDDVSTRSPLHNSINNHPYTSSIASSASSSSSSIFSADGLSSQSSAPSCSSSSLNTVWESDNTSYFSIGNHSTRLTTSLLAEHTQNDTSKVLAPILEASVHAVAPEFRQHPRRTQPLACSDIGHGNSAAPGPRPPPSLVRQCDRKDNFVDSLVDTTTQMIEVIWPLSTLPCNRDTVLGGKNLIGLRTFVQEVLKRSKTSYSTLQVALYYLVLVKPYIPGQDFTMEQSEDSQSCRAMQCGRRMFLAALILASKYLQDRNYSTRAWSKISGLKTFEINTNEMAFLSAVGWKLHIPEPLFQRWTDVVLKYSPSAQLPGSPRSSPGSPSIWKLVVPTLTPELDTLDFGSAAIHEPGYIPFTTPSLSPASAATFSPTSSSSNEQTPTITPAIPRFLEPNPQEYTKTSRCGSTRLPPLPHLGFLPTPQMTPQTSTFSTPAVGATGSCFGKSSMSAAMAQVQTACIARTTLDSWRPMAQEIFLTASRRSSLARTASSLSSPESMISDVSTRSSRSSRSSSLSSVASSTCALPQPRLAVQATRRCANMQLSCTKKNPQSIIPSPPDADGISWEALNSSPESYFSHGQDNAKVSQHSQPQQMQHCAVANYHDSSDQEAAEGLRDLALNRPRITSLHPNPQTKSRKRERPGSIDVSLQQNVRQLIAPRGLGDITNNKSNGQSNEDDGTVLMDRKIADSFVLRENFKLPDLMLSDVRLPLAKDGLARKRACCAADQAGNFTTPATAQRGILPGPGMWKGVL